jgi:hypothetical protein
MWRRMMSVPKNTRDWEAEDDFRTLARAEEIKSSRGRLSKAKTAGRRIVKEEQKALRNKQRVANPPTKRSR